MIGKMTRLTLCALAWLVAAACPAQDVPPLGKSGGIALPDPPRIPLPREIPPPEPAFFADITPGLAIDTANREATRVFYKGAYSLSDNVAINWTGVHDSCTAGVTDQLYQNAVALRINWFRAMAGVPGAVSLYGPYSVQDQQAALVMSANNSLSHTPPSNWYCWSQTAYDAAGKSNLSLGAYGPDAVVGYMRDPGSNNSAVGHRRWLLYPQTHNMGSGDVPAGTFNGGDVYGANALWVIDSNFGTARPVVRDGFVAWPPKGYAPYPVVFGRWSFSYPNADFTNATVTVAKNGISIPISKETLANPAYGENTLVWLLQGFNDSTAWPKPAGDETYAVTIGNVLLNGSPQTFAYNVIVFDPDVPTSGAPQTTVTPPASTAAGSSFSANIGPMADATAYQVARYRLADLPSTLVPGATPNPWSYITGPKDAYNPIEATSYHLYHSDFSEQSLTLNKKLYIGSNASLSFLSWFTYATDGQTARVQLSLDDGISWQDIYTEIGSNQTAQTTKNIPLSAFAGRFARLRFVFSYEMGMSAYYSPSTGWYFKNVSLVNVRDMLDEQVAMFPSTQNTASFTANTPASHVMAARTQYQGLYFTDWGPASVFQVTTTVTDTAPDSFNFSDQTDVEPSTPITSNAITVSGINAAAPISISGGSYSINGGAFTSTSGTVSNGQTVTVRVTSSSNFATTASATLTIGGVSDTFSVTTRKQYSTTTLMANVNPVPAGTTVTLTALVNSISGTPTPTGSVTFREGMTPLATVSLIGGTGSYSTNVFTSGSHFLSAEYSGDGIVLPSQGSLNLIVADAIGTSIKLATAPRPSSPGQSVQVGITVTPASNVGTLSGTIAVSGGGKSCTITLPATSCSLTFDTPGLITLTATYSGNPFYAGSTSTLKHRVGKVNIAPILMLMME